MVVLFIKAISGTSNNRAISTYYIGFHYISQVSTNSERKKLMETDYLSRYWRTQVCLNDGWSIWWCWGAALNAFDAFENHEESEDGHDADANAQDKGTDAAAREVEAERSKILGHQRFNVRWECLLSQFVCKDKLHWREISGKNPELDPVLSVQMRKMRTQVEFCKIYTWWQNNTIILAVLAVKGNWLKIWQTCGRPRVFGGDLDDYFEATGEMIPAVVQSCVDTIRRLFLVAFICFFVFCKPPPALWVKISLD